MPQKETIAVSGHLVGKMYTVQEAAEWFLWKSGLKMRATTHIAKVLE